MSHCTCADLRKHALTTRKETGFPRLIIPRSGVRPPPGPHHAYGVQLAAICSGPLGPAALGLASGVGRPAPRTK